MSCIEDIGNRRVRFKISDNDSLSSSDIDIEGQRKRFNRCSRRSVRSNLILIREFRHGFHRNTSHLDSLNKLPAALALSTNSGPGNINTNIENDSVFEPSTANTMELNKARDQSSDSLSISIAMGSVSSTMPMLDETKVVTNTKKTRLRNFLSHLSYLANKAMELNDSELTPDVNVQQSNVSPLLMTYCRNIEMTIYQFVSID